MNDFQTFYEIGVYAASGGNIYAPAPSTGMVVYYLPLFAVLMSVFSLLPFEVAAALWTGAKLFVLIVLLHRVCKIKIESEAGSNSSLVYNWKHVALAVTAVGASLSADIALGQINTFLAAGFLFIWLRSKDCSHLGNHQSALVFAVIASKITPFALIAILLFRGSWRLALMMVSYTAVLNGVAAIILDASISELLASLVKSASEYKLAAAELTNEKNQSLVALVGRFYLEYWGTTLPTKFAATCTVVSVTVLALILNFRLSPTKLSASPSLNLRDLSLGIVISLILSPDTRTAHLVQLLAPMLLLVGWSYAGLVLAYRLFLRTLQNLAQDRIAGLLLAIVTIVIGAAGTSIVGIDGLAFIRSRSLQGLSMLLLAAFLLLAPHRNPR
jgi:hypothetical protein